MGEGAEFNYGFWGQECGPEKDPSRNQIHKYMQDAVSANRCKDDCFIASLQ